MHSDNPALSASHISGTEEGTGPPRAPGSALSLVWACAGFLVAGVVFGAIAIVTAKGAQEALAKNPDLRGRELAQMGYWFGVLAIVQHVIRLIWRLSAV